jgi:hypothetical protein
MDETTEVGCDVGEPVSPDYGHRDNGFNGKVRWVQIDIDAAAQGRGSPGWRGGALPARAGTPVADAARDRLAPAGRLQPDGASARRTQRKPTWLVEVSTGCALPRRRTVALAIVGRAQVRAALEHLAWNADLGLAVVVAAIPAARPAD